MEAVAAVRALAALAQETRLEVFRLLVQQGPSGLAAGEIASRLGIAPATLSFHLKELSARGAGHHAPGRALRLLFGGFWIDERAAVVPDRELLRGRWWRLRQRAVSTSAGRLRGKTLQQGARGAQKGERMKRFHVHVSVPDLTASIRFYSTLFGSAPAVVKGDYAKWMLEDPRVNFAISQRGGKPGVNHLGLQTDSDAELESLSAQLQSGRSVRRSREGSSLLLCAVEQVLGDRPHRHCLGDVSHAR